MTVDQYDELGESYNIMDRLPYRRIESRTVEAALRPLIHTDSAVLELACGTGYYSSKILSWGAKYIAGLDLSTAMVKIASSSLPAEVAAGRASFCVGDAAIARSLSPDGLPGAFDVIFAAWLLNYAHDRETLTAMFANIALNLRPGGVFVGVVPHPTDNIAERAAQYKPLDSPLKKLRPLNEYKGDEGGETGGWALRVHLADGVNFLTCHMPRRVYEEAARAAGLSGRLEWREEVRLRDLDAKLAGLTLKEWEVREATPHCGLLVVYKD